MQHIKGIANILADSVSRLRAVGLYHELDFKDGQQDLSTSFKPSTPCWAINPYPHRSLEIFIKPNIENLMQNYDTQKTFQLHKQRNPNYL